MHDLVIRNADIIDGAGTPRRSGDIAIAAGRLVEIGRDVGRGREEIDAKGLIAAPGFIDCHTHDDLALLVDPAMTPKISQGVTTCVCGNCGVSLAPLPDGNLPEPLNLMADDPTARFPTAKAYLDALVDARPACNSVPLMGHTTLRAKVMDRTDRPASDREVAAMAALLREALQAGFHGVSTGTYYAGAAHATTGEIINALQPLKDLGGVYATHMRDEADSVLTSIEETAAIGRALGVTAVISHHKTSGRPNHGRSTETLARIADLAKSQSLALDVYPYTAGSTVLRADRVEIADRTLITASASCPQYVGREANELATELGITVAQLCERLAPAGATYFMMREDDVERIMAFDGAMIGSDGIPLQAKPHPRLWGTFPRVLGHYCRDRGLFSLETAVHKMTGLTARRFGLTDRGVLAVGKAADLVLFDAATVADRATFEDPELPSAGISQVIVNGEIAWRDGAPLALAGRLLARGAPV